MAHTEKRQQSAIWDKKGLSPSMSILRCFDNLCVLLAMTIWSIHLFPSSSWNCCQTCWPQCWVSRLIHVDIYTLHIISILICINIDMYYIYTYITYTYYMYIYILHIFILHIHIINTDIYRWLEVDFVPFPNMTHVGRDPRKMTVSRCQPFLDDPLLGSWWSLKQLESRVGFQFSINFLRSPWWMMDFSPIFQIFPRWIW